MKHILLIIIIILIIPYHSFSEEYIIIRVCKAITGCPVNIDTGECPTCIMEKRKVQEKIIVKRRDRKRNRKLSKESLLVNHCCGIHNLKR
ncbi:uncharacterized protein METZ01_LOCUS434629 [marine metagenome]|uniref:Uncharacterized protein n=1 Tax=marine metagenome TaxID=408172 RepID=A0A382YG06_9ZZZZ